MIIYNLSDKDQASFDQNGYIIVNKFINNNLVEKSKIVSSLFLKESLQLALSRMNGIGKKGEIQKITQDRFAMHGNVIT